MVKGMDNTKSKKKIPLKIILKEIQNLLQGCFFSGKV
jgi:hypothetical protein